MGGLFYLPKAFDKVDHKILHKVEFHGVRGFALEWFRNYLLNDRKQFISYKGVESECRI